MKFAELKNIIKESSLKVRNLKNQRKTANLIGERTIDSYRAVLLVNKEKRDLRKYHIAYGLLRGRTYEQIEQKVHDENKLTKYDWKAIDSLIEKYRIVNTEEDDASNE